MATTAIRHSATPVQKRPKWNTLQVLRGSQYTAWGMCVLFLIAATSAAAIHRNAMTKVCKDTAPNVIHAEEIKFALSDMDANAANELLFEHGDKPEIIQQYEDRREEAVESLIQAAENINYGDAEREPIKTLALNMGTYQGKIEHARDLHQQKNKDYVAAYLDAAKLMDGTLLPAADALHRANEDAMNRTYANHESESTASVGFVMAAGLALAAFLLYVQWFLLRKTRRILNPMLALATVLALGFVLYTVRVMSKEREQLKVAKEDAFNSVVALWQARSVAYAANADESRYLLDPTQRNKFEADFYAKAGQLGTMPPQVTQKTDAVVQQWFNEKYKILASGEDGKNRISGFSGYLADELDNVTFKGEREAALDTLRWFGLYVVIDRQIREKELAGNHEAAVELCLGSDANQSNWAFDQFDKALDRTLEINQKEFDKAVELGFEDLNGFDLRASVVVVAIALLVFAGLLPRIGEYR